METLEMKTLEDFYKKLLQSQKDLEPEYQKFINEHFWELIDCNSKGGPNE